MLSELPMASSIWSSIEPNLTLNNLQSFGNSAFTTSLIGALAGAFFGASAAQRIAQRSKLQEDLVKEIRNTNAGLTLAFAIANTMMGIKKQHVMAIKATYDEELVRHSEYIAKRTTGQIQGNAPYELHLDLRMLPQVSPPITTLQEIVFGSLSVIGRPLSLSASIAEAIQHFNTAIDKRNELIEMFKEGRLPPGADLQTMYLGLPYADGHTNQEYGDTINAIATYADDAIFFCSQLCRDLREHGIRNAAMYKKKLNESPPRVTDTDFKKAQELGLLPKDDDYSDWFTAFQPPATEKHHWWQRVL